MIRMIFDVPIWIIRVDEYHPDLRNYKQSKLEAEVGSKAQMPLWSRPKS